MTYEDEEEHVLEGDRIIRVILPIRDIAMMANGEPTITKINGEKEYQVCHEARMYIRDRGEVIKTFKFETSDDTFLITSDRMIYESVKGDREFVWVCTKQELYDRLELELFVD